MAGETRDEYRSTIIGLLNKVGLSSFTLDTVTPGDGSCCLKQEKRNVVTEFLKRKGFSQMLTDTTHIAGGLIDQVYVNREEPVVSVERYSPY